MSNRTVAEAWERLFKERGELRQANPPKPKKPRSPRKGSIVWAVTLECGSWWDQSYDIAIVLWKGKVLEKLSPAMYSVQWQPNDWTSEDEPVTVDVPAERLHTSWQEAVEAFLQLHKEDLLCQVRQYEGPFHD